MNEKTTYNGWSNYETWLANLWIANDEPIHNLLVYILKKPTTVYAKAVSLAEAMRELLEDETFNVSLGSDLLQAALERVRWVEIVQHNS
jgi:hypothetical protein